MKSNSYQVKQELGVEQKIRFSVGLNSISENKLCLGGKYVAQKQNKQQQQRETNDL